MVDHAASFSVDGALPVLPLAVTGGAAEGKTTVVGYLRELGLNCLSADDVGRAVWEDKDVSVSKGGGITRYFKESKEMLSQIVRVKINDMQGLYKNL